MTCSRLVCLMILLVCSLNAYADIQTFSGSYDGTYDPYSLAPPSGQSTWVQGTATIQPVPSAATGEANFTDSSTGARIQMAQDLGLGTFSADQWDDELTITARLKLGSSGIISSDATSIFDIGLYNEYNGLTAGKVMQLGFAYDNSADAGQPGLWLSPGPTNDPALGAFKLDNVNYFDDQWHTYTLDKYIDAGVAKVQVSVDGIQIGSTILYDDLQDATYLGGGIGYFGSTPTGCQVTMDYLQYQVNATVTDPIVPDSRNIRNGMTIPDEGYCDQPYVVKTANGNWLCTMTTGPGVEGERGQHVVSTISTDKGQTWAPLTDIEPTTGPEASWAMPLVTDSGRIYAFYAYNDEGITDRRADMLGSYMFKYSDDNGQTWSTQRYEIPIPLTAVDRNNTFNGDVQMFWGVGKPIITGNDMYLGFTKIGTYLIDDSEGFIVHSDNIMTETDPTKIHWEILPDGDVGIMSQALGSVQEEHNLVALNEEGSLYCMYRTTTGSPAHTYSRDGGHTWDEPVKATYEPNGREIKNPRANAHLWKTAEGRYLLWYSNEGLTNTSSQFLPRNPNWLSGGIEIDGKIYWSQPELVLYDPEQAKHFSYPDLIQEGDNYWITETDKSTARVHAIDSDLINGLWTQGEVKTVAQEGLVLEYDREVGSQSSVAMPSLPDLTLGGGFSVDLWLTIDSLDAGQIIADARDGTGKGMLITTTANGAIQIDLADGDQSVSWTSDPGLLKRDTLQHVVANVDGGPKIISFIVDGVFNDGGSARDCGYVWFDAGLGDVNGDANVTLAPSLQGSLQSLCIYDRALRTSEVVGNYNAVEQPEVRTLAFDGAYDPYGSTPPEGQNKWFRDGALLSPTFTTNGDETYAVLNDNLAAVGQRIQMSHDLKDIRTQQWTCETRFSVISADDNDSGWGQFVWGVRDEGGDGKCVLLNWFNDGLYLTDNTAMKNESSILVSDTDFRGDGFHIYRMEKLLVDDAFALQVYIDDIAQFATPLAFSSLPDDASTNLGFGYYTASFATSKVWMDYMTFGAVPVVEQIPGDANNDGRVDGSDVTILANNWQHGVTGTADATWEMGDFNGDGCVDGSDVTILANNWQAGVTAAAASVPEPGALLMLLAGSISLSFYAWCK